MERERTRDSTVAVFESDEFRITVIQRASIQTHDSPVGRFMSGCVEPVAVVIEGSGGDRRVVKIG